MVTIEIGNRTREFVLNFHDKFNFLTGNSGSQKTYFIRLCEKKLLGIRGVTGTFKIDTVSLSPEQISIYTNRTIMEENFYRTALKSRHHSLFIIDEFCTIFKVQEIVSLLLSSDNYFIFANRKVFDGLSAEASAVYKLEKNNENGKYVNKSMSSSIEAL